MQFVARQQASHWRLLSIDGKGELWPFQRDSGETRRKPKLDSQHKGQYLEGHVLPKSEIWVYLEKWRGFDARIAILVDSRVLTRGLVQLLASLLFTAFRRAIQTVPT